jgi:hypothetical protein
LIPVAKQPGRRAQKRHEGSEFKLQAAQRLSLSHMIATMHQRIWKATPDNNNDPLVKSEAIAENTGRATFGVISNIQHPDIPGHKRIEVRWKRLSKCRKCIFQSHKLYLFVNALAARFVFAPNTFGTNTHSAVILVFNPEVLFTTG